MLSLYAWRLQEMFAEYFRALRQPATPVRTFRLRAVLFPAVEQSMTEEELADGAEFFTTCVPQRPLPMLYAGPHGVHIILASSRTAEVSIQQAIHPSTVAVVVPGFCPSRADDPYMVCTGRKRSRRRGHLGRWWCWGRVAQRGGAAWAAPAATATGLSAPGRGSR